MPSGQWGEACFPSGVGCGEPGALAHRVLRYGGVPYVGRHHFPLVWSQGSASVLGDTTFRGRSHRQRTSWEAYLLWYFSELYLVLGSPPLSPVIVPAS